MFEINDGLWGELAAGRHGAAGQAATARDPKRRKSGRIVSGAASGVGTEQWLSSGHRVAKAATNAVVNRWGEGPNTAVGVRERLAGQGTPGTEALLAHVSDEQIVIAIEQVRKLHQRWTATPPGGTLRLAWPLVTASEEPVDERRDADQFEIYRPLFIGVGTPLKQLMQHRRVLARGDGYTLYTSDQER